ncbi:MAG: HAMP domain-containing histidine kinase, partial [Tomitella sp.]|nr:HAMP domain-containing histidine kinase [Tomitella sp.]
MHDQIARRRRRAADVGELSAADENTMHLDLHAHDLSATIRAAAAALSPRCAERGVTLTVRIPQRWPGLPHDRHRIEQVVTNLLDNALTHTPVGGEITVRATRPDEEHVRVSVIDTGDGIPPEHLETIFDRFHRLDPARDPVGSGLGLTIARSLVRAHGGTLTAANRSDTPGARFDVTLPLAPPGR